MPRRTLARLALAAAVAAPAAATGGPSAAVQALPDARGVGSPSGGDPYFPLDGNGGYDVRRYRIAVTYRPRTGALRGTTLVRAIATQDLSRLNLDLALVPDGVRVDGMRARFRKANKHELVVVPRRPLAAGQRFDVRVRYHHARPHAVRAAGVRPFLHSRRVGGGEGLAVGEPQIGPWWFAANETPADKAAFDIRVRVPQGRQAVANGELLSRRTRNGWTTWRWRLAEPTTTYLAFFAAGRFRLERGVADGRPFVYAVSKGLSSGQRRLSLRLLRRTPRVVGWLEGRFGPYPFRSIGGLVTGIPTGFALENASRPTYPYVGGPNPSSVSLLVHELAHQWFGDDVALRRWRDIWLNEGFATYAEWLYDESLGRVTVPQRLRSLYDAIPGSSGFWGRRLVGPGADHLFDAFVYARGAMTLAALRNVVGPQVHATLLRRWASDHRRGHGTTAAFRTLAEEVSGVDLDAFFDAWLRTAGKPADTAAHGLG